MRVVLCYKINSDDQINGHKRLAIRWNIGHFNMFQFQNAIIKIYTGNLIVSISVQCFSQNMKESAILPDSFCSGISLNRLSPINKKLYPVNIYLFIVNKALEKGVKYDVIFLVLLLLT